MGPIYPYLVRKEYLQYQADADKLTIPLGHDVYIALVEGITGMVRSLSLEKLRAVGMSVEQAHAKAIQNLGKLFQAGEVHAMQLPEGPGGKPFILIGGHWDAAACAVLPDICEFAKRNLQSDELCFSIPHTEAFLLFREGDRAYRDDMRRMIREKESDGRKPLTFDLFTFEKGKPVPFSES